MESEVYEIESNQRFSDSKIWQINRDFYNYRGLSAFSEDIVPHHLTSNAFVGKTYAELFFAFLRDLSDKGITRETVYILELGAGHGRLAFHFLQHLERLVSASTVPILDYCYILSDIVEENLVFFENHPQFEKYINLGVLDVSHFDAVDGKELNLRISNKVIQFQNLKQPIVAIANYFFDSIPTDLFVINNRELRTCAISIKSRVDPEKTNPEELIENLDVEYSQSLSRIPIYNDPKVNEILSDYKQKISSSYLLFPERAMQCISNIKSLSAEGLLLLSLDKGFHELRDLESREAPEIIKHGSFSIYVNYHALGAFCERHGGKSLFPTFSTFHLELACLMFLKDSSSYPHLVEAYNKYVDDFGPDDLNSLKLLTYKHSERLIVTEIIALARLSGYDSTYFIKLLPRIKQVIKTITLNERNRVLETMHKVWEGYFSIGEKYDLAYEIAGIFYELGAYEEALDYFRYSVNLHGHKPDTFYNIALSYYQLREDKLFKETIIHGKEAFPQFDLFENLDLLDVS